MVDKKVFVIFLLQAFSVNALVNYTVSGMSSGGYMAGQMHVSHSSSIQGVGIVVAGPYYCSQGSVTRANTICTYNDTVLDVAPMIAYATLMSSKNQIDPVSFLSTSTVYIFSGLRDELMIPQIVEGTYNFYKAFVPLNQITFVEEIPINHAWPTKNSGNPCWYYGQFFVNSCGYDGAGIILTTLLGPLYQDGQSNSSNLFSFPQTKYVNVNQAALDVNGWIYVPTSCQKNPGNCRLHVNIHGCGQEFQRDGLNYINNIGMNIWAEGNDIVIIYPQTVMTAVNQGGCWDIDGYTGPNFALKSGIQIQAIHGMAQDYVNIVRSLFM